LLSKRCLVERGILEYALKLRVISKRGIVSQDVYEIFFCEVVDPLLDESVSRHAALFALLTVALAEKISTKRRSFWVRFAGSTAAVANGKRVTVRVFSSLEAGTIFAIQAL
jgi:hypothetical protein